MNQGRRIGEGPCTCTCILHFTNSLSVTTATDERTQYCTITVCMSITVEFLITCLSTVHATVV